MDIKEWERARDQVRAMSPEELDALDAFWEQVEEARQKLPEEWKKEPKAMQDIYIVHGVDIRGMTFK